MTQANLTLQKKETKDTRFLWACILDRTLSACFASLPVGLHDCSCRCIITHVAYNHAPTHCCLCIVAEDIQASREEKHVGQQGLNAGLGGRKREQEGRCILQVTHCAKAVAPIALDNGCRKEGSPPHVCSTAHSVHARTTAVLPQTTPQEKEQED